MELTTIDMDYLKGYTLFMMSKIQNLNGTHNLSKKGTFAQKVVYDVKDTKFEWNSQQVLLYVQLHHRCL